MSLVKISGNASGTGTLTVAAPNTNSDYTLTLPTNSGTITTTASTPTFTGAVTSPAFIPNGSSIPSDGVFLPAASTVALSTASTERMRVDSSGYLLVGTTSALNTTHTIISVNNSAPLSIRNSGATAGRYYKTGPDTGSNYIIYNESNTGVYVAYGGTSWTASSDERLKTDLVPIENAEQKVLTLRCFTGRFKTDEEGTSRSFLIAQDVQAVLPEAVSETPDGNLGLSYTDVIPLLTAAIKELSAKLDEANARIAALETK